jgi:uncharacterized protein YprB with RNaseH-like and TPR domain
MAMSESRRRKLAMLTRSLAVGDIQAARGVLGRLAPTPLGPPAAAEPVSLAQAAPGVEQELPQGKFWLIRRALRDISGDYLAVQGQYAAVLRGARQRFDELAASAGLCHIADGRPEGPLFMDIETCGLAGCPVFLVGLMSYQDGQLVFEQLLARHYGEEAAIVAAFADRLASASTLVTFNGKSFDMNMLRERSAFHGLELAFEPPHCDLLHESRRRWRGSVPNCRLQTLEQYLCRRRRVGDIAGAQIPDAYHRFVSDGDARQVKAILHHNLLDLLTMSQLLCAVLTGEQPDVDA